MVRLASVDGGRQERLIVLMACKRLCQASLQLQYLAVATAIAKTIQHGNYLLTAAQVMDCHAQHNVFRSAVTSAAKPIRSWQMAWIRRCRTLSRDGKRHVGNSASLSRVHARKLKSLSGINRALSSGDSRAPLSSCFVDLTWCSMDWRRMFAA